MLNYVKNYDGKKYTVVINDEEKKLTRNGLMRLPLRCEIIGFCRKSEFIQIVPKYYIKYLAKCFLLGFPDINPIQCDRFTYNIAFSRCIIDDITYVCDIEFYDNYNDTIIYKDTFDLGNVGSIDVAKTRIVCDQCENPIHLKFRSGDVIPTIELLVVYYDDKDNMRIRGVYVDLSHPIVVFITDVVPNDELKLYYEEEFFNGGAVEYELYQD